MTCDGYDVIIKNIKMPELQVGDWIIMGGMGAYTYGARSFFNGMDSLENIYTHHEIKEPQSQSYVQS